MNSRRLFSLFSAAMWLMVAQAALMQRDAGCMRVLSFLIVMVSIPQILVAITAKAKKLKRERDQLTVKLHLVVDAVVAGALAYYAHPWLAGLLLTATALWEGHMRLCEEA